MTVDPAGPAAPPIGLSVPVEVGRVAHGGTCVARLDGRVVFVRHTLPGERVRLAITDVSQDRYWRADAVEILTPSPDRVSPPCPHSGPGGCGGCDWQHVTPAAQRLLKSAVVAEQMQRLAGLEVPVEVEELPGAPDGLGWRTRIRYAVDADGTVGLRRNRSHEVVPVPGCPIAHPLVLAARMDGGPVDEAVLPGLAAVEVVASPSTGRSMVSTDPPRPDEQTGDIEQDAVGRRFQLDPSVFWQVHPAAPDALASAVLAGLDPRPGETALDLYGGAGLFAAALAERVGTGGHVVLVESDPVAVTAAARSLADLPQVSIRGVRVTPPVLRHLLPAGTDGHLVVLDPPRAGAGAEVMRAILAAAPRAVAYVACDPASLARDVAVAAVEGYRLAGLRAFDLFPMTAHIECVAILVPAV